MTRAVPAFDYPVEQRGLLLVENSEQVSEMDLTDALVGLQYADDGRIWLCVNGVAFIRFTPREPGLRSSATPAPSHTDVEGTPSSHD
jgi:hypothetical protein